ncbi:glycosyltransferase family 39 protein [Desulfococcaceae bacterium HSG8]|nr:glycosyltransferase family 39 protein [Desulfococcaceae bacterium HSG8]
MYEIPSLAFSYFPLNLPLLYTVPLYLGNDIIPKFIHFSFALMTAWLIFIYLRKRLDAVYGLFGAFFFLSIPLIVKLSITAYVDLGLTFFSTASLFYLLKWIENSFRSRFLIISAIWCGFALGTKYNGLMVLFLLTLFVPFVYSKLAEGEQLSTATRKSLPPFVKGGRGFPTQPTFPATKIPPAPFTKGGDEFMKSQLRAAGYGIIFMLVSLLIFSPWMIRNYTWTNNPIYPLYDQWFNPGNPAPEYSILTLMNFDLRSLIKKEPWWEIALLPVRIFFQGEDGSPLYFDGKLNPFLLFLPFLAFYGQQKTLKPKFPLNIEKKIFAVFSILVLLFVLFTTNMCQLRYIAIIIPPLVILSVLGLHELFTFCREQYAPRRNLCTGCGFIVILLIVCLNGVYIGEQFRYVDPINYITGRISRDEYIERYRHEYPAIQFANKHLPWNSKILGIFLGERRYYSDREFLFDINWLLRIIKEADSPEKIAGAIHQRDVTHLLIRYDLFNEWINNNFDDRKKQILGVFLNKNLSLIFQKSRYGLFRFEKNNG